MENLVSNAQQLQASLTNSNVLPQMQEALAQFTKLGTPNKKNEAWKYTNITPLLQKNTSLEKVAASTIDVTKYILNKRAQIIFVDGNYCASQTQLPAGVQVQLAEDYLLQLDPQDALELYNLAVSDKTLVITVAKNTSIREPITLLHLQTAELAGKMLNPRILFRVNDHAQVSFYESYRHLGKNNPSYTINSLVEFSLAAGARVEHIKAQIDSLEALHIGKVKAEVGKDATFNSFTFSVGASISRNNIHVQLKETGAATTVHGLYALRDQQLSDQYSIIDHGKEHTQSRQLFKGILDDAAHGVFCGKIIVHKDAQQITSTQLNKNILLGKKAHINTRPILEIYADDVKCAHGATVGQIDPEQVFYLQSRGISLPEAQKILCHGFAQETIDTIGHQEIRDELSRLLITKYERYREIENA